MTNDEDNQTELTQTELRVLQHMKEYHDEAQEISGSLNHNNQDWGEEWDQASRLLFELDEYLRRSVTPERWRQEVKELIDFSPNDTESLKMQLDGVTNKLRAFSDVIRRLGLQSKRFNARLQMQNSLLRRAKKFYNHDDFRLAAVLARISLEEKVRDIAKEKADYHSSGFEDSINKLREINYISKDRVSTLKHYYKVGSVAVHADKSLENQSYSMNHIYEMIQEIQRL